MSSYLNSILSAIDPSVSASPSVPGARQPQAPNAPKPAQRPVQAVNGGSQAQPLKRKADGQPDGAQAKLQRKDAPPPQNRPNGSARPASGPDVTRPTPSSPANPVPYRGTAASSGLTTARPSAITKRPSPGAAIQLSAPKPAIVRKPNPTVPAVAPVSKTTPPVTKPAVGSAPTSGTRPTQPKMGSYAAMLAKAKQVQVAKPAAPPVRHEPMKVLTKKERMELHAQAKAGAKGVKQASGGPAAPARAVAAKGDLGKEKRKPADLGYQGTARPIKKAADIGYKGTARPAATAGPAGKVGHLSDRSRSNSLAAKPKPKADRGRYGGYASCSDEEEEEEEEDYASDASSDMEGGIWDMEQEERRALEAAKKEDAEALREENELKRQKEERKKKLAAMSKAAAAKRKY
ncbi:hypothetical protein BCR34DRAFT_595380 [Clohesyomyces aquaticus]|uniref:SPT2 chromatin protein-domain-containing protein n=1 Tax=Clohesyomyces aquaticus TaxID=1231657 RepID=A0A1Y2AA28_9PLEO|nr:hypothetical protein BCR34DRAFT_595380 [Clohesyomyces aquaticus]